MLLDWCIHIIGRTFTILLHILLIIFPTLFQFSLTNLCYREDILKTAKALVEETKKLVQGAASDQETLAGAAQQAVKTITKLADVVKLGAASLGSNQPEAQVCSL